MLWAGRIVVLTIAVMSFLIASDPDSGSIMELVSDAWGVFGAAFGPATGTTLRVTGSSAYRIRLNGGYVGYGPARGPKGYFRVDEWKLPETVERL